MELIPANSTLAAWLTVLPNQEKVHGYVISINIKKRGPPNPQASSVGTATPFGLGPGQLP